MSTACVFLDQPQKFLHSQTPLKIEQDMLRLFFVSALILSQAASADDAAKPLGPMNRPKLTYQERQIKHNQKLEKMEAYKKWIHEYQLEKNSEWQDKTEADATEKPFLNFEAVEGKSIRDDRKTRKAENRSRKQLEKQNRKMKRLELRTRIKQARELAKHENYVKKTEIKAAKWRKKRQNHEARLNERSKLRQEKLDRQQLKSIEKSNKRQPRF